MRSSRDQGTHLEINVLISESMYSSWDQPFHLRIHTFILGSTLSSWGQCIHPGINAFISESTDSSESVHSFSLRTRFIWRRKSSCRHFDRHCRGRADRSATTILLPEEYRNVLPYGYRKMFIRRSDRRIHTTFLKMRDPA